MDVPMEADDTGTPAPPLSPSVEAKLDSVGRSMSRLTVKSPDKKKLHRVHHTTPLKKRRDPAGHTSPKYLYDLADRRAGRDGSRVVAAHEERRPLHHLQLLLEAAQPARSKDDMELDSIPFKRLEALDRLLRLRGHHPCGSHRRSRSV